jgi:dolichol kinase
MTQFIDEKDSSGVITTHIQLLLGCAIPLWLSFRSENTFIPVVGILAVAVGDAAAATWGSR